jgi:hypothetical protein
VLTAAIVAVAAVTTAVEMVAEAEMVVEAETAVEAEVAVADGRSFLGNATIVFRGCAKIYFFCPILKCWMKNLSLKILNVFSSS